MPKSIPSPTWPGLPDPQLLDAPNDFSVRKGQPSWTAPSFSPALACDHLLHVSRTYANQADLIAAVAERAGLTKADAGKAVEALVGTITEALTQGDEVRIAGFG